MGRSLRIHGLPGVEMESTPMRAEGESFVGEVEVPTTGGAAWFGEAVFAGPNGGTYTLTTPPEVAPEPKKTVQR